MRSGANAGEFSVQIFESCSHAHAQFEVFVAGGGCARSRMDISKILNESEREMQ